nr:hypothetical protein [candidate division Zixibacteria bacterium]
MKVTLWNILVSVIFATLVAVISICRDLRSGIIVGLSLIIATIIALYVTQLIIDKKDGKKKSADGKILDSRGRPFSDRGDDREWQFPFLFSFLRGNKLGFWSDLLFLWPAIFFLIAIYNFIFESLGSGPMKMDFLFFTSVHMVTLYLAMYMIYHKRKTPSYNIIKNITIIITLLFGLLLMIRVPLYASYLTDSDYLFQYRIDNIMEHRYRMCHSPYMPEAVYKALKRSFNIPYFPELLDTGNTYQRAIVYGIPIGDTGIIAYEYVGESNSDKRTRFNCLNHGELRNDYLNDNLYFLSLPDGEEICPNRIYPLNNYRGAAIYSSINLPPEFHFIRWFSLPGSMTNKKEFFIFDLSCISNLEGEVKIITIWPNDTEAVFEKQALYQLRRTQTLFDWILAKPYYKYSNDTLAKIELADITDITQKDSLLHNLSYRERKFNYENVKILQTSLDSPGGGCCFLLEYETKKDE